MTEIAWIPFPDPISMHSQVASKVGSIIDEALSVRGRALLALSGGSSPFPIYSRISSQSIDWEKVTIVPVDDRLVDDKNRLSNIRALRAAFGQTGAKVLPLFDSSGDPAAAPDQAERLLHSTNWPPDLVWLGMGADGHFASIFPGPDLDTAFHPPDRLRAILVRPDPLPVDVPVARISLTVPAIADARNLMLIITGAEKKIVLDQAIADRGGTPIGRFLATLNRPIEIYWTQT